jgi:hypothetical protein
MKQPQGADARVGPGVALASGYVVYHSGWPVKPKDTRAVPSRTRQRSEPKRWDVGVLVPKWSVNHTQRPVGLTNRLRNPALLAQGLISSRKNPNSTK